MFYFYLGVFSIVAWDPLLFPGNGIEQERAWEGRKEGEIGRKGGEIPLKQAPQWEEDYVLLLFYLLAKLPIGFRKTQLNFVSVDFVFSENQTEISLT